MKYAERVGRSKTYAAKGRHDQRRQDPADPAEEIDDFEGFPGSPWLSRGVPARWWRRAWPEGCPWPWTGCGCQQRTEEKIRLEF